MKLATKTETCNETYLNHPIFGLLYKICLLEDNRELFASLYAMRLFFLVTTETTGINFESIGRTNACLMVENRLRQFRRNGELHEYSKLQVLYQQTFS